MKALVLTAYQQMEYRDVPDPVMGTDDVLIRVKACGICGSDIHGYDGSTGRRQPPLIMGHEASGVIEAVGANVADWKAGDRVTFDSTIYCNECDECRKGNVNLCANRRVIGVSCDDYRQDGAFAELIVVPRHILYRLPDNVTFDQAAMIEPLSIAFHAANRAAEHPLGATAAVSGCGKIGMLLIQTLRSFGFGKIAAIKRGDSYQDLIQEIGADVCFTQKDDVYSRSMDFTDGKGFDYVFEAAGNEQSLNRCISICRRKGKIILVGNSAPTVSVPLQKIVTGELNLCGSCASSGEYDVCLDMISRGSIAIDKMIGTRAPLSEGAEWFNRLYNNHKSELKVILNP